MKNKMVATASCVLASVLFSMNAYADDRSIANALANDDVGTLSDFLVQQGYAIELDQATVTNLDHSPFLGGEEARVDMNVTLIPFATKAGDSARIAAWEGYWGDAYSDGAIATIGERDIYLVAGGKVRSVEGDELDRYLNVPLYAIPGASKSEAVENDEGFQIASGCKIVDVARIGYTALGFVAYKFHQRKHFCYTGSSVHSVNVDAYVSSMDPNFYYRGVVSSWNHFFSGSWGHDSMRQGQIDNCVLKYGCIGSYYPSVQIRTYGNGSWDHSTWD